MTRVLAIVLAALVSLIACSSAPPQQSEETPGVERLATMSSGCFPLGPRNMIGTANEVSSTCPAIAAPTAPMANGVFYLAPDCYWADSSCMHIICPSGIGQCQYGRDDLYWQPSFPGWYILKTWPHGTDCVSAYCADVVKMVF